MTNIPESKLAKEAEFVTRVYRWLQIMIVGIKTMIVTVDQIIKVMKKNSENALKFISKFAKVNTLVVVKK